MTIGLTIGGPSGTAAAADRSGEGAAAPAYPQYWKRNTLVVDLSSAPAAGSVTVMNEGQSPSRHE